MSGIEALLHGPEKAAGMNIERETLMEAGVSLAGVLVFTVAAIIIGLTFKAENGLSGTGGLAIIGSIVLFIVVMSGIGLWLSDHQ